jgi:hypothetical protein
MLGNVSNSHLKLEFWALFQIVAFVKGSCLSYYTINKKAIKVVQKGYLMIIYKCTKLYNYLQTYLN